MSETVLESVAKVYAEALFDLASESGTNDMIRQEMQTLAELMAKDADFSAFLESPAISRKHKLNVLTKAFSGRFSDLTMNFLAVTAGKARLGLLPVIIPAYMDLEDGRLGQVKGILTTAVALENSERIRYSEQISRALRKKFVLKTKVDPSIIGGMILTVGDKIMDGSILGSLRRVACQLRKNTARETASMILEE